MKQLYIKVTICFFFFWIFNSKRKINNLKIINTSKQISFIKVNSFIQFLFDILANWLLFRSLLLRFFLSFFFRISLRKRFFLFPFARCFLYPYKMIKIREGNFIFFFFFFFGDNAFFFYYYSFCTNTGVVFKYSAQWSNSVAYNYLRIFKFYGGINNEAVVARVNPATVETRSDREFSINKILRCHFHQLYRDDDAKLCFHLRLYLFVISS